MSAAPTLASKVPDRKARVHPAVPKPPPGARDRQGRRRDVNDTHSPVKSLPSGRSLVNVRAPDSVRAVGTAASTTTTTITAGVVVGSASTNIHPDVTKHSSQSAKKPGSAITVTKNSVSPAAALPSRIPVLMSKTTLPSSRTFAAVPRKTISACHSRSVSRLPVPVASASPFSTRRYSASPTAATRSLTSSASRLPILTVTGRSFALRPVYGNIMLAAKDNCKNPRPLWQGSSPLTRHRRAAAPSSSFNMKNSSASASERALVGATEDIGAKKWQKSSRDQHECSNEKLEPPSCSRHDHNVAPIHAPSENAQQLYLPVSIAAHQDSQCDERSQPRYEASDANKNSGITDNNPHTSKIPETTWGKVHRAWQSIDTSGLDGEQEKAVKRMSLIFALQPKRSRNRNRAARANNAGRIRYMIVSESSELPVISEEKEMNERCISPRKSRVLSMMISRNTPIEQTKYFEQYV